MAGGIGRIEEGKFGECGRTAGTAVRRVPSGMFEINKSPGRPGAGVVNILSDVSLGGSSTSFSKRLCSMFTLHLTSRPGLTPLSKGTLLLSAGGRQAIGTSSEQRLLCVCVEANVSSVHPRLLYV